MPHTKNRKLQADQLKERVCYLLNWTPDEYAEYQYKQGCLYLQMYLSKYPAIIDELLQNRIFWAWWRNQWANRDDAFIHDEQHLHVPNRRLLYRHTHDPEMLILDMYPQTSAFAKSYSKMIGEVAKQETKP